MNRGALLTCFISLALCGLSASAQTTNKPSPSWGSFEPNLPVIFLDAKQPIVSEEKVPCTIRMVCPKGSAGAPTNTLPAGAKPHGSSSRGYPKKSFSITLDLPAQLLGMRTHDTWILNAAYIDRSLMRHKLSYDLFRSLSTDKEKRFAAASRFVELYHNQKYQGVYLLIERVDKSLLGLRSFNSNEVNHSCLYKAVDHAANFSAPGHDGYEQREPNPLVKAYSRPLDEFNQFVSSANPNQFWDPQRGIQTRLDLDNAIDFHLLVLLTSNSDGITKNFHLARNASEPGKPAPRFFFVPWDYDGTFGRNWDSSRYPATEWLSNNLFERLLQNKNYREKFVARWKYLRDHQFSVKTIHAMIDQNIASIGPAARRNATKWPTSQGYPDGDTFEQDIALMKSWTHERVQWLDQEIDRISNKR